MNSAKKDLNTPSSKLFILGCILAILLGVILHFAYDFLNKPFIFGLFIPVNESIWEHLKLALVPMTVFGIIFLLAGIAAAFYGTMLNNDIESQMESIFRDGQTDPGNIFLFVGIAVALIGLLMFIKGLSKKKR